jgi:2,3-bisphosphoglycerate-dependent phosphoglycerate mutase
MKIYILRHEDRTTDCSFFSPLSELGLNNSKKLIQILKDNNINMVISSPFIRTLQTVHPYLKETSQLVNVEYGLSEIHHQDIIPPKSVGIVLPEYLAKYYNYNPNYVSFIKPNGIKYPENTKDCENRMKLTIKNIIEKYYQTDYNILIVTHQSLCNTMMKIINKFSQTHRHKLTNNILIGYQKGKLSLIFDNDWTFKKLN